MFTLHRLTWRIQQTPFVIACRILIMLGSYSLIAKQHSSHTYIYLRFVM